MAYTLGIDISDIKQNDKIIALAGNPNVGKSTVFNSLTGLKQHTGNWPGKTVDIANGEYIHNNKKYVLVDIPGTYSLMAQSDDEESARDFICFGNTDAVVVVCDATCLERNLNLVLQTIEITKNVVVCVNLLDEAKRKNIQIDLAAISEKLGVPVVGTSARSGKGLCELANAVEKTAVEENNSAIQVKYTKPVENAIESIYPYIEEILKGRLSARWVALKLIDYDEKLVESIKQYVEYDFDADELLQDRIKSAKQHLLESGISAEGLRDIIVSCIVLTAEDICSTTVCFNGNIYNERDRKIDRFLTSHATGIPVMIALFAVIFWITITGANYPSELISKGLFWVEDRLLDWFNMINSPPWISGVLVLGMYRTLAWVVSVMLPPMAIFFPLFTLLEDLGYLPRIAFNLDKYFKKACACGKQALTMCIGYPNLHIL